MVSIYMMVGQRTISYYYDMYVLGDKGKSVTGGTCILDTDFFLPLQNTGRIRFGLHLCMAVCTVVPLDTD